MSFNPPPLPPGYGPLQVWWEDVRQSLKAELGSLEAAEDALAAAIAAQASATAAAESALDYMPEIADVTITADYTGAVDPSVQLPKVVLATRFNGTTDVTTSSTWSASVVSGGVTASIDSGTGVLTITAVTSSGVVEVSSERTIGGLVKTLSTQFNVALSNAPAPIEGATSGGSSSGSGGTTATDTTFSSFHTTSMAAVSNELSVTVGSGGQVQLSAPLAVTMAPVGLGAHPVYGIWRRWNGASYVDVGTEVVSSPNATVQSGGDVRDGALSVGNTVTGLTPATTEKFQLYARNSGGALTMYLSGTASVVGS